MSPLRVFLFESPAGTTSKLAAEVLRAGFLLVGSQSHLEGAKAQVERTQADVVILNPQFEGETIAPAAIRDLAHTLNCPLVSTVDRDDIAANEATQPAIPFARLYTPIKGRELELTLEAAVYQHRTDMILQEVEHRAADIYYRATFAESPIAMLLAAWTDGRILDANLSLADALGYEVKEVTALKFPEWDIWSRSLERVGFFDQLSQQGLCVNFPAHLRTKSNEVVRFICNGVVFNCTDQELLQIAFIPAPPQKSEDNPTPAQSAPPRPPAKDSHHILLVDDEPAVAKSIAMLLEFSGHRITMMHHPKHALEFFASNHNDIDLVLTDHKMPNMSGLDLARQMRGLAPVKPIVLLSGFNDGIADEHRIPPEISRYLAKPIEMDELIRVIDELLEA